jgi:hypothetical protein
LPDKDLAESGGKSDLWLVIKCVWESVLSVRLTFRVRKALVRNDSEIVNNVAATIALGFAIMSPVKCLNVLQFGLSRKQQIRFRAASYTQLPDAMDFPLRL